MQARDREPGIDVYRGFCVLSMFCVHAARMQADTSAESVPTRLAQRALDLALGLEPFTLAAFVFTSGISVVLAHEAKAAPGRHDFLRRMAWRSAYLGGSSIALFLAHYGAAWPDLLVSSGLLAVIALGTLGVALCLLTPLPTKSLCWFAAGVALMTAAFEHGDARVGGLNAGEGALLPTIAFAPAGALFVLYFDRAKRARAPRLALTIAGVAAVVLSVLLSAPPFIDWHARRYPEYGSEVAIASLLRGHGGSGVRQVDFWNHTVLGFWATLPALCASAAGLLVAARSTAQSSFAALVSLLGRHALFAYVCHLTLLALASALAVAPRNALETWLAVLVLTVVTLAAVRARRVLPTFRSAREA